jgi:uncharacterized membrane protein
MTNPQMGSQLAGEGISMAGAGSGAGLRKPTGQAALRAAVALWFVVTAIGQWIFVVYIVMFYGGTVAYGETARWDKFLTHGLIPGDHIGNTALALHLGLAAVITAGGPLQLIPRIRARAPAFHRWLGRAYLIVALVTSVSALYLVWVRNAGSGSVIQELGITLDAALIMTCGAMALRHALARRFAAHRRWALRLFLVVSGVWFFRAGVFFSLIVNHGPFGFDPDTFQGPFLNFLSFADSLVPLAILELYLRRQAEAGVIERLSMATGLVTLTIAISVGIFGVFMFAWLPSIKSIIG